MQEIGWAGLGVVPTFDARKLDRDVGRAMSSTGRSGGRLFGRSAGRSAGSTFGSVFKGAIAAAGVFTAGRAAFRFLGDSLDEARESQEVQRQTAAVLKSTGGAAKVSEKDIGKLANRLSYMAGVDDELIQSNENVLLTFKGVRNEVGKGNRIFDRGAKVALNMSKALGTDMKGASIQVGKALNDPVKGITALTRVGVTFTTKQKAQIKALVEGGTANAAMALGLIDSTTTYNNLLKEQDGDVNAVVRTLTQDLTPAQKKAFDLYEEGGHTLEAQKRILKELGSEFGGSARAQADAGDRLEVAYGNIKEQLGKGLLPITQKFSRYLLREGVPAAKELTTWVTDEGIPDLERLAKKVKPLAEKLLPAAGDALGAVRDFGKDALPYAEGIVDAFNDMPDWVKKVLIGGAAGGLTAKKLGLGSLLGSTKGGGLTGGSGLLGLVSKAKPVPVFVTNPGFGGGLPGGGGTKVPGVIPGGTPGSLPKFAPLIPIGLGSAPGQDSLLSTLTGGKFGLKGDKSNQLEWDRSVLEVKRELTDVEKLWMRNKDKANDYFTLVRNNKKSDLFVTVTGWDIANAKAREQLELILQVRNAMNENKLDRAGGSGTKPGSGFDPSSGTQPHGGKRGVNITIDRVVTEDPRAFLEFAQRRARGAASDGWR